MVLLDVYLWNQLLMRLVSIRGFMVFQQCIQMFSLSVLSGSFSNALFENKEEVGILDVYIAIRDSKRIYPDSRVKECAAFREKFFTYL